MVASVFFSAAGSSSARYCAGLGLGQDHRQRVADDVVHVAGQPGLVLLEPGDLPGLLGLALARAASSSARSVCTSERAARAVARSASPASHGTARMSRPRNVAPTRSVSLNR